MGGTGDGELITCLRPPHGRDHRFQPGAGPGDHGHLRCNEKLFTRSMSEPERREGGSSLCCALCGALMGHFKGHTSLSSGPFCWGQRGFLLRGPQAEAAPHHRQTSTTSTAAHCSPRLHVRNAGGPGGARGVLTWGGTRGADRRKAL